MNNKSTFALGPRLFYKQCGGPRLNKFKKTCCE